MTDRSQSFEVWYRDQHPALASSLVMIAGGNVSMALEATDEAFARAYAHWPRVSCMASPGGWTYRTAVNVLRRRERRRHLEAKVLRVQYAAKRAEQNASAGLDWSFELLDVVRQLPIRQRTAITLRYVADMSTDDIAYVMNVSPGTVGSTLHSARKRLAELLDAVAGATPGTSDSGSELADAQEEQTDA